MPKIYRLLFHLHHYTFFVQALSQELQNSVPKVFIATFIDIVSKCHKICQMGNKWNCALFSGQKDKISPASEIVATARITPKICEGQPPEMYSECLGFHPDRFSFGRVIAKHVNTAKLSRRVNPIFDRSLASVRIVTTARLLYRTFAS